MSSETTLQTADYFPFFIIYFSRLFFDIFDQLPNHKSVDVVVDENSVAACRRLAPLIDANGQFNNFLFYSICAIYLSIYLFYFSLFSSSSFSFSFIWGKLLAEECRCGCENFQGYF